MVAVWVFLVFAFFMEWDDGGFCSIGQELCHSSMIRGRAQGVFSWQQVQGCFIMSFVTPSGAWCLLVALQLSVCVLQSLSW